MLSGFASLPAVGQGRLLRATLTPRPDGRYSRSTDPFEIGRPNTQQEPRETS
ncbi:hypothetical protein [Sabulicella rubraurantiaca]|uniref:hypothetical protein n=1 Tax=Sabulicella rubraurantiaca TaxID=2811429 RepID=UPI001A96A67C|nr:hypothetical protein [Sabulicella rubraurantiaca]